MFIKRNEKAEIIALSKVIAVGFNEQLPDDDAQIIAFLHSAKTAGQLALEQTDQTMARVMEDVVNLLVEQGVIRFTDLPDAAQHKLLNRRELRGKRQGIDLLDDGDNLHL